MGCAAGAFTKSARRVRFNLAARVALGTTAVPRLQAMQFRGIERPAEVVAPHNKEKRLGAVQRGTMHLWQDANAPGRKGER
jgi:hypothetical protein